MSVQDLIAEARKAAQTVVTDKASVVVGDAVVELTFEKVLGAKWSELTASHGPRQGSERDTKFGYNLDAVSENYPNARIRVGEETPTADEWTELFRLLDAPYRETVALKLWQLNQFGPAKRILELGKASSGGGSKKNRPSRSS